MSDLGILAFGGQGDLAIEGVSLCFPGGGPEVAWTILDLSPLWGPAAIRGGGDKNTLIPGVPGRWANPQRMDQTTIPLILHITGAVDSAGDAHSDPVMGLALNLDYLWDNVASPPTPPAATRSAVLTMPDDTTREADVQVQMQAGDLIGPYDKQAALFVTVPSGRFVEVGS